MILVNSMMVNVVCPFSIRRTSGKSGTSGPIGKEKGGGIMLISGRDNEVRVMVWNKEEMERF